MIELLFEYNVELTTSTSVQSIGNLNVLLGQLLQHQADLSALSFVVWYIGISTEGFD